LLARLLGPFKNDKPKVEKKAKEKVPRKDKKKEEVCWFPRSLSF